MNFTVNSARMESAHNQSASSANGINSAPKVVVRKNQGPMQKDNKGVPTAPRGIGDNKTIHNVSVSMPHDHKTSSQEDISLGDKQERETKQEIPLYFFQIH